MQPVVQCKEQYLAYVSVLIQSEILGALSKRPPRVQKLQGENLWVKGEHISQIKVYRQTRSTCLKQKLKLNKSNLPMAKNKQNMDWISYRMKRNNLIIELTPKPHHAGTYVLEILSNFGLVIMEQGFRVLEEETTSSASPRQPVSPADQDSALLRHGGKGLPN